MNSSMLSMQKKSRQIRLGLRDRMAGKELNDRAQVEGDYPKALGWNNKVHQADTKDICE